MRFVFTPRCLLSNTGFVLGLICSAVLISSTTLPVSLRAEPVAHPTKPVASPLEPAESIKHFQLDAGLQIELAACEPAVVDPIAIRFDEDGRLWVVEMRDYPNGPKPGEAPLSRICPLVDADGDGRYESSQVFADELLFPTGLQPWQGGLIVTLAGQVVYLKDTDSDGRADLKEVWFQGFAAENPQLWPTIQDSASTIAFTSPTACVAAWWPIRAARNKNRWRSAAWIFVSIPVAAIARPSRATGSSA